MKTFQNFSLLFWIWRAKVDKKGRAPIFIRITIDGQQAQISSGIKIEPEYYNAQKEQVISKTVEAQLINQRIQTIRAQIQHQYLLLAAQHETVHPQLLKETFLGTVQPRKTFMDVFTIHNETFLQKVKAGKRSIATHKKYHSSKQKLRAFLLAEYGSDDIPLNDVKQTFPDAFEHYLSVYEHQEHNTIMKHIKNLKKVLNLAVQKELIKTNPFQFYKCTYESGEREKLNEEELKKLMDAKFSRIAMEEARDSYVAMCFTGYAYKDAAALAPSNIVTMEDGEKWFIKNREKTSNKENVPILPVVQQIIDKYKKHRYCIAYNKVFPIHSNQKFNDLLKQIAKATGINKCLTTHTARHTFATTVTLTNGMPIETISALLGHSSIKTTQIYAKIVNKKVSEDMQLLKKRWSDKLD